MGSDKKQNKKERYIGYSNTRKGSVEEIPISKQKIHVLSETPGPVKKEVKVTVKRGPEKKESANVSWKIPDSTVFNSLKPDTQLPRNEPFWVLYSQKRIQTEFEMHHDPSCNDPLRCSLHPFTSVWNDPISIYHYMPEVSLAGTSYFKSIGIEKVKDDGSSLLYIQEMKSSRLHVQDGAVKIEDLDESEVKKIVKEILGVAREGVKPGYKILKERELLMDFGYNGKFYVKTIKGKQYVVFKGYAGLRKHFTRTHYQVTDTKVLSLSAAGRFKTAMKGTILMLVIVGSIEIAEWALSKDNESQVADLLGTLGMTALKTVISSVITAGIAAWVLAALAATGAVIPVLVVIVGFIAVGVFVGKVLDIIDSKTGATKYVQLQARKGQKFLEKNETWQNHVAEPLGRLRYLLEESFNGPEDVDKAIAQGAGSL